MIKDIRPLIYYIIYIYIYEENLTPQVPIEFCSWTPLGGHDCIYGGYLGQHGSVYFFILVQAFIIESSCACRIGGLFQKMSIAKLLGSCAGAEFSHAVCPCVHERKNRH